MRACLEGARQLLKLMGEQLGTISIVSHVKVVKLVDKFNVIYRVGLLISMTISGKMY